MLSCSPIFMEKVMILSPEYFIAKEKIKKNVIGMPIQAHHISYFGTELFGEKFQEHGQLRKAIELIQILNDEFFDNEGEDLLSQYSMIVFKGSQSVSAEKYQAFVFNYEKIKNQEKAYLLTNKYSEELIAELKTQILNKSKELFYIFNKDFEFNKIAGEEEAMKFMLSSDYFVFKKEKETTPEIEIYNKAGRKIDWAQLFLKNISNLNIERVFFYNFVLGFKSNIIDDFFYDEDRYKDIIEYLECQYVETNTQWAYYFQNNRSIKNLALPTIIREMEEANIEESVINTFLLYVIFDQRSNRKKIKNIDLFEGAIS